MRSNGTDLSGHSCRRTPVGVFPGPSTGSSSRYAPSSANRSPFRVRARSQGRLVAAAGEAAPRTHRRDNPSLSDSRSAHRPGRGTTRRPSPCPGSRRRALVALAKAVTSGTVVIDPGADPSELRASLVALPGDRAVDGRVRRHARPARPRRLHAHRPRHQAGGAGAGPPRQCSPVGPAFSEAWRPWRSYAMVHMWAMPEAHTPLAKATGHDRATIIKEVTERT